MNVWLWIAFGLIVFIAVCLFVQIPQDRRTERRITALEDRLAERGKHRK